MKNIALKLVKVMADCDYIQKQGKNTFHNYRYAMAADVLEKVNASLVSHNIASFAVPELIEFKDVTNAKGNTEHLATVKMHVTLIDADSGESIEVMGLGSGQDVGDKAVMKAQTAALKYCWMLTLNISTGDDPEADNGVDERMNGAKVNTPAPVQKSSSTTPAKPDAVTDKQLGLLVMRAKEYGITVEDMKLLLKWKFHIDNSKQLTKAQAGVLINNLIGIWEEFAAQANIAATKIDDEILMKSVEGK